MGAPTAMISLTYSNRTGALLDCLTQSIQVERQLKTPWEPIQLLVPNPTVKDYVRIQLAQRLGIAANLHFSYLEDIGHKLLTIKNGRIITNELLHAVLLGILGDANSLTESCLTPIRYYLSNDTTGLKLVQLASQLTNLYSDYDTSRPLWISSWRKNQHISTRSDSAEAWQQCIWLKVIGSLDKTGIRHLTLSEAAAVPIDNINNLNLTIHAFGFTCVAQTYYQIFAKLGELGNLHLYAINPCQEFWEDLTIGNKITQQVTQIHSKQINYRIETLNESNSISHGYYESTTNEPEALHRWGRAGQTGIRSLNNISQYDFETCFEFPKNRNLLSKIQKDILLLKNSSTVHERTLDTNIKFWACPNQRRETEILATEIWHLLDLHAKTDKPMSFSDIAVVLPHNEEQSYTANIQAAFQEAQNIPWTQKNHKPDTLAEMIEATKLLINLPTSCINRIDIIRTITHPKIANHLDVTNSKAWVELFNAIGAIYRENSYSWIDACTNKNVTSNNQDMQQVTPGIPTANNANHQNKNNDYKLLSTSNSASLEKILNITRTLLNAASLLQHERQNPKAWSKNLKRYLLTWLAANNEAAIRAIEQILNSISKALESAPAELPSPNLEYTATRFLIIEALAKLHKQQPCELTGGIVVSSLDQICSIPFRAVFILGLGENTVLTTNNHNALNLRLKERKYGDTTQSEKEQYSFLEILVLTQEHLYLSYIAHDQLTGISLEPSYLFKELTTIVKDYLQIDPTIQCHPLHRFDPIYFYGPPSTVKSSLSRARNYAPIAQSEAKAIWLRDNTYQTQAKSTNSSSCDKINLFASLGIQTLAHTVSLCHKKSISSNNVTLPIKDVIKWLECPLTGAAAIKLGLRNDSADEIPSLDDEVFKNHMLHSYTLLQEATLYSSCNSCTPEIAYAVAIKNIQTQGQLPFELFAQIEKDSNLALMRSWLTLIEEARPEIWHLGPGGLSKNIVSNYISPLSLKLQIKGAECLVNLIGSLRPQLWNGSIFFEIGRPPKSNLEAIQKKALRAYVDQMILSCITNSAIEHRAWFLFSGDEGKNPTIRSITFKPVCRAKSYEVLSSWIQDILENNHAVLMPIEALLAASDNKNITKECINNYVDAHMNNSPGGFSSMYGPVPNLQSYGPPSDITAIIGNRLADFLDQVHTFDALK